MAKQYERHNISEDKRNAIKVVRLFDRIFDNLILVLLVVVLLCSSFIIFDNQQTLEGAGASQYEQYKPTDEKSFEELRNENEDAFGWIEVYGTGIDYPLVQAKDNYTYVSTNVFGKASLAGSIFLDAENSRDLTDFNSIIYGHHMAQSSMFGDIDKFDDESFFNTHKYGEIYTSTTDQRYGIEFFAYILGDAYDWNIYNPAIQNASEAQKYLGYVMDQAKHVRPIEVSADDRIVVLSTCASEPTNGRYLLVGKLSDELFENSFIENNDQDTDFGIGLPSLSPIIICLIVIAITLFLIYLLRRKNTPSKQNEVTEHQHIE